MDLMCWVGLLDYGKIIIAIIWINIESTIIY